MSLGKTEAIGPIPFNLLSPHSLLFSNTSKYVRLGNASSSILVGQRGCRSLHLSDRTLFPAVRSMPVRSFGGGTLWVPYAIGAWRFPGWYLASVPCGDLPCRIRCIIPASLYSYSVLRTEKVPYDLCCCDQRKRVAQNFGEAVSRCSRCFLAQACFAKGVVAVFTSLMNCPYPALAKFPDSTPDHWRVPIRTASLD
jgi:hypothetical protein